MPTVRTEQSAASPDQYLITAAIKFQSQLSKLGLKFQTKRPPHEVRLVRIEISIRDNRARLHRVTPALIEHDIRRPAYCP